MLIEHETNGLAARKNGQKPSRGRLWLAVRVMLGMTQRQLAEIAGVTRLALHRRENQRSLYTLEELRDLRALTGMTGEQWVMFYESLLSE